MLNHPSARLHQPVLQARQRPAFESLRQSEPPPQVTQVIGHHTQLQGALRSPGSNSRSLNAQGDPTSPESGSLDHRDDRSERCSGHRKIVVARAWVWDGARVPGRDQYDSRRHHVLAFPLAYVSAGHPDWREADISIFACFPAEEIAEARNKLNEMITEGRLPIPRHRVRAIPFNGESTFAKALCRQSVQADLVIRGLSYDSIARDLQNAVMAHKDLRDILFVHVSEQISIS